VSPELTGASPKPILGGDKFPGMARQRSTFGESPSVFHPSQVFTDTSRVDLFDDPRWETEPFTPTRRSTTDEPRRPLRRTVERALAFRRVLKKRGQHSRSLV
jgi:hypothetical protein